MIGERFSRMPTAKRRVLGASVARPRLDNPKENYKFLVIQQNERVYHEQSRRYDGTCAGIGRGHLWPTCQSKTKGKRKSCKPWIAVYGHVGTRLDAPYILALLGFTCCLLLSTDHVSLSRLKSISRRDISKDTCKTCAMGGS